MQWHFCLYYLAYFVHFYIVPSFVILDIDELDEWFKTHLFHYLLTPSIIGLSIRHCPSESSMSDFWYTTQAPTINFWITDRFFVIQKLAWLRRGYLSWSKLDGQGKSGRSELVDGTAVTASEQSAKGLYYNGIVLINRSKHFSTV